MGRGGGAHRRSPGGRQAKNAFFAHRHTKPVWTHAIYQHQCKRAKSHMFPAPTAHMPHLHLVVGADLENKGSFAKMFSCQQVASFRNLWGQFLVALSKVNKEKMLIIKLPSLILWSGSGQTRKQSLHILLLK